MQPQLSLEFRDSRPNFATDYAPGCTLLVPLDHTPDADGPKRLFESIYKNLELERARSYNHVCTGLIKMLLTRLGEGADTIIQEHKA